MPETLVIQTSLTFSLQKLGSLKEKTDIEKQAVLQESTARLLLFKCYISSIDYQARIARNPIQTGTKDPLYDLELNSWIRRMKNRLRCMHFIILRKLIAILDELFEIVELFFYYLPVCFKTFRFIQVSVYWPDMTRANLIAQS